MGYGAGGGSAGKISAANITHPIAVDGGRGAPGVVYIEVVPIGTGKHYYYHYHHHSKNGYLL